jgi:hypothetical protein
MFSRLSKYSTFILLILFQALLLVTMEKEDLDVYFCFFALMLD